MRDDLECVDAIGTLEVLPPRGGGSAGCPKKDKRRVRRGSREQNTHNTQINLNKLKLGEP